MFLVATANTYEAAALQGAEAAAKAAGNVTIHPFNGNFSASTQVNQVQDATATGQYNAFLVDSYEGTQMVPSIEKALQAKITVVCGFSVCGKNPVQFSKQLPVTAQISANYVTSGQASATALSKACAKKNPCNIVYMAGTGTLAPEVQYKLGLFNGLKKYPNIKIVATGLGLFLAAPSETAMKPIIAAHPNIDGVVSVGDQMAEGAQKAIETSALPNKGKMIYVSYGASTPAKTAILSNQWYSSDVAQPYTEGYQEARYAIAAARGKPLSPDLVNTGLNPKFPSGYVDKANAAKWTPQWAG